MIRLAFDVAGDTPADVAALVSALFGAASADGAALDGLTRRLDASTAPLRDALGAAGGTVHTEGVRFTMTNPGLDTLARQVAETSGILDSATAFIVGVPGLIETAVAAALANGATAAELEPIGALAGEMRQRAGALADAVAANSPPPV